MEKYEGTMKHVSEVDALARKVMMVYEQVCDKNGMKSYAERKKDEARLAKPHGNMLK